jgi:hypothetical protein
MANSLSNEKAYILGLLTGGGQISKNTFVIDLPFDKWGEDPERMAKIATDILTKISNYFKAAYGFPITYTIGQKRWTISPMKTVDIASLIEDMKFLGLPSFGSPLNTADLSKAKERLKGIQREYFLSGIFDARASLTKTHRRFTSDAPVVSIEIPGSTENFRFVVQLCSWLTEMGSVTDQILFNHPCQHSGSDPTYKGWKKGFKIRFLAKSFITKHSFAMHSKALDVDSLQKKQKTPQQFPCKERKTHGVNPVSIHEDIKSKDLPEEVRAKLFFHYHHICAVMDCPFAPVKEMKKLVDKADELIFVFPRIIKGPIAETRKYFKDKIISKYFSGAEMEKTSITCQNMIADGSPFGGYGEMKTGLAYLFSKTLNGKRHVGPLSKIIDDSLEKKLEVESLPLIDGAPILISNPKNGRSAIVSSQSGKANLQVLKKTISIKGLNVNVL